MLLCLKVSDNCNLKIYGFFFLIQDGTEVRAGRRPQQGSQNDQNPRGKEQIREGEDCRHQARQVEGGKFNQ